MNFFGICAGALLFSSILHGEGKTLLIDVRTQAEWAEKHIPGAELIDIKSAEFKDRIAKLDKNASYAVFCRSGNRSAKAEQAMKDLGIKNVKNLGSLEDAVKATGEKCNGPSCNK